MLSKTILGGLLLLSLMGCGTPSTRPLPPPREAPAHLTQAIPEPVPVGRDNAALATLLGDFKAALKLANSRLLDIREWSDAVGQ